MTFRTTFKAEKRLCRQSPRPILLILTLILGVINQSPAFALSGTDVSPGDACSTEDAVMMSANPSGSGGYIMTCESNVWVATMSAELPTANEHVATKEYVDTVAAAGGGDNGRFTLSCFNPTATSNTYGVCVVMDTQTGQTSCRMTTNLLNSGVPWSDCAAGASVGVTSVSGSSITVVEGGGNIYAANAKGWGVGNETGTNTSSGNVTAPLAIDLNLSFTKIEAGQGYGCGVASSKPYCWGQDPNSYNKRGPGTGGGNMNSPEAVNISSLGYPSIVDIALGGSGKGAIRDVSGNWHAWGYTVNSIASYNFGGASSFITTQWRNSANGLVDLPNDFTKVVFSNRHMCALRSNGNIHCAADMSGNTSYIYTLGNGPLSWGGPACGTQASVINNNYTYLTEGCPVSGGHTFTDVAVVAGSTASCAVANDGEIYCWGSSNGYGVLGKGDTVAGDGTPVAVDKSISGAVTFEKVYGSDTGGHHFCALDSSGQAYCWGRNNNGQLGTGDTSDRYSPTPVLGNYVFEELTNGDEHTCGVTAASGTLYCWGVGNSGRLGYGSTQDRLIPEPVSGGTGYVGIAAGNQATYAWE